MKVGIVKLYCREDLREGTGEISNIREVLQNYTPDECLD